MECLTISDFSKVNVRLNLQRFIDENQILNTEIMADSLNEVHFTLDLYSNGRKEAQTQYSKFFILKSSFNQPIIFNWHYEDLSSDSTIAISLWSSAKRYNTNRPLASTVISMFDEYAQLRQGKYHLFLWPDVFPDLDDPSTTPGLTNDPNIETVNFITSKLEECNENPNSSSKLAESALTFKLSYTYRLIPAAFVEVQFPKFAVPIFYTDKVCVDYIQPVTLSGQLCDINECIQFYDPDFENNLLDPLEQFFYNLKRQNEINPEKLVPTREEIKIIENASNRSFRVDLKPFEKELFATYRYFLSQDKKYLCHYLNSIQWNVEEDTEIQKLLYKWQRIDQADALYLLSKEFSLNPTYAKRKLASPNIMKIIRDYAVTILTDLKDQELISNLLFLIQTLRYQGDHLKSYLFDFLKKRSASNAQITALMYWYLKTESQTVVTAKDTKHFREIAQQNNQIYYCLFNEFESFVCQSSSQMGVMLERQEKFINLLRKISKVIKEIKEDNNFKKQELRKRLAEVNWEEFGTIHFPMDVSLVLKEPVIPDCTMFFSAMVPLKLTFLTTDNKKFSFMYKCGDDLRQDQMILQMFSLMDRLLKGVNQDYKLTPYKAMACSKSDGYVQFVPESRTFQDTNLKEYLNSLVKSKSHEVMENYVFSCAGYCAITYFFGIGDRHLQNLLIDSSGKMLHIDFGFILGRDPKPYPPPIKIRKDMIEAMGGTENQNFKIFKTKCLQAYLYLRKHYKLVYNLVFLMLDSGIKDVHMEGMSKLIDKFEITMNDKEAEKHFLMVLEECRNAIFAIINDKFHKWAEHFK